MKKLFINIVILYCVQHNILYVRGGGLNARRKFLGELPFCGSGFICKPYCHPINKPSDTCESGPNFIKHGIPFCLCTPLCNSFCESINTICEEPNENENSCTTIASQSLLYINDRRRFFSYVSIPEDTKCILDCNAKALKCCRDSSTDTYKCDENSSLSENGYYNDEVNLPECTSAA